MRNWCRSDFIDALRRTGDVSMACQFAVVSRAVVYELRLHDQSFRVEWEVALTAFRDHARRRARRMISLYQESVADF